MEILISSMASIMDNYIAGKLLARDWAFGLLNRPAGRENMHLDIVGEPLCDFSDVVAYTSVDHGVEIWR
jgi:hypothetical protein